MNREKYKASDGNLRRGSMRVVVTGGSGMVGSNLRERLSSLGIESISPNHKNLDLTKQEEVSDFFKKHTPDAVIHCAGLVGGIHANIARPYDFAMQNMSMGSNIVKSCLENGVEKLINLGSSCMYPREGQNPLREESLLSGPLEPTNEGYAIAKIAVSRLCKYSNSQFGTDFKTLIPCNLYGKYDDFDLEKAHLIPGVIHRMHLHRDSGKESITIWGDGSARREFMYASDLADFICFALSEYRSIPQELNVGLGFDFTVKEYYQMIAEEIGYSGNFEFDLSKPTGMKQKLVDVTKQEALGWSPPTDTREGIRKTYSYFVDAWL